MSQSYRRNRRHQPCGLLLRIVGWSVVLAGLAMLVLPGPGLLALALGVIVLGPDDPALRGWAVRCRLSIRRLCHAKSPAVRTIGYWLRGHLRQARLLIREQLQRHARGEPLSLVIRLWIVLTIVLALASAGVSLYMILS